MAFGAMSDKDLAEIAALLFPAATRLILTQFSNPRAATVETQGKMVAARGAPTEFQGARTAAEAISIAEEITPDGDLICITGSLYLVGDVQRELMEQGRQSGNERYGTKP